MVKMINKTTGTLMYVDRSRLFEYLRQGHKRYTPPEAPEVKEEKTPEVKEEVKAPKKVAEKKTPARTTKAKSTTKKR